MKFQIEVLHQLISEQYSQGSSERYYLFPGLISLNADDNGMAIAIRDMTIIILDGF